MPEPARCPRCRGLPVERSVAAIRRATASLGDVVSVTPDLKLQRYDDPSGEPLWKLLWGLHNTGQRSSTSRRVQPTWTSTACEAEGVTGGDPAVIVAVIDDGVDFSHPDLADRAWTNPGESGGGKETNGVDDDGNGYIDDVHGWDFCNNDNTVHDFDQDFHGTHVSGTIAASLNGVGVVGVAPNVKIMALKFLGDGAACGDTSMALEAIAYAKSFGVVISNNSWGGRGPLSDFQPLYDAIRDSGMLFIISAGNDGIDNDTDPSPAYPATFDLPNIVSVAAADRHGGLADFSNFGRTTVDIAAPGVDIASAFPAETGFPVGWAYLDGTSMASPHVTGVAALIASADPSFRTSAGVPALRARLLATGKSLPLTASDTVTGRMIDARFALDWQPPVAVAPNSYSFLVGSTLGSTSISSTIGWPAATDDAAGVRNYELDHQVGAGGWTNRRLRDDHSDRESLAVAECREPTARPRPGLRREHRPVRDGTGHHPHAVPGVHVARHVWRDLVDIDELGLLGWPVALCHEGRRLGELAVHRPCGRHRSRRRASPAAVPRSTSTERMSGP